VPPLDLDPQAGSESRPLVELAPRLVRQGAVELRAADQP
jgi:hypothetical protein